MKNFTWSYTALTDFETCPFAYAAKRIYKTVPQKETEAIIWGTRVHSVAENILKGNAVNDPEVEAIVRPYCSAMLNSGGKLRVEWPVSIDRSFIPTEWFDRDTWGRGVIDVCLEFPRVKKIYDWKTGKEKRDDTQLKVFCMLAAAASFDIETYEARFVWLKDKKISDPVIMTRNDISFFMLELNERVFRIEEAVKADVFQPKPNGLCRKWCEVTHCKHCGRG